MKRKATVTGVLIITGILTIATAVTGTAVGKSYHQQVSTATVNPATVNLDFLALPYWALPTGAAVTDRATLTGGYCVPETSPGITDEFLLVHQDWCQGLQAATGLFETFRLDPSAPYPVIAEWAASVYSSSPQAQQVVSGIVPHEQSQNDSVGPCAIQYPCQVFTFQDVETIENPDGTTSPGVTRNVLYAVWVEGNIVAEVAIVTGPNNTAQQQSSGNGYLASITSNAHVLLQEILAGQSPAPPTATPTVTNTATATMTPTATLTPTATQTPIVVKPIYRVSQVAIQLKDQPNWAQAGARLTRLKLGQKAVLAIYLSATSMPPASTADYKWDVFLNGKAFRHHEIRFTLPNGRSQYWARWAHSFMQRGSYRFLGTVTIDGVQRHRAMTFVVK